MGSPPDALDTWIHCMIHVSLPCRWISTGCGMVYWQLNSLRLSDEYMHHQPKTSLVQIMSCGLFGAKPSSEPILYYLLSTGPLGTNFSQIVFRIRTFSFNKISLKMSRKWWIFFLGLNVFSSIEFKAWVTVGLHGAMGCNYSSIH